jgi:heme A synthase
MTQDTFTRRFPTLALTTTALTFGLIVFGAVVRVTDSGLGCGNHWPLCNGTIIPPLDNLTAWIEWLHRLFALLIGLLGLGMLGIAVTAYRQRNPFVLRATAVGAGLFVLQSLLGAIVVVFDLPPTFVTLHLGTAMLLLAALLVAGLAALYRPVSQSKAKSDFVTTLIYANTALSLVIILTGALVRGSGATLACTDWPLCNGELLPFDQGLLQVVHMVHRFAVASLGVTLAMMLWYVLKNRSDARLRGLAWGAFGAFWSQAAIGAMFVWSAAAPLWGAAHVGMAAATWGLLVALSLVETLNNHPEIVRAWQPYEAISN